MSYVFYVLFLILPFLCFIFSGTPGRVYSTHPASMPSIHLHTHQSIYPGGGCGLFINQSEKEKDS